MANASRRSARSRPLTTPRTYAVWAAVALLAGCGHVSAHEPGSGQISTFAAVVAADGAMPSSKATGTPDCAADHDGTSVAYSWTLGGVTRSASSCDHPINRSDSLAIQLERVADTVIH